MEILTEKAKERDDVITKLRHLTSAPTTLTYTREEDIQLNELARDAMFLLMADVCDVCAGYGEPISGKPCMCGGSGRMSEAALHLRSSVVSTEMILKRIVSGHKAGMPYPSLVKDIEDYFKGVTRL